MQAIPYGTRRDIECFDRNFAGEAEDTAVFFQRECLIRAESAQVKDNEQVALLAGHLLRGIVLARIVRW